ncbi:hypothetical protein [Corynebacterium dentalis]|uniref:hypothetical protein n=1 Tax=Corynebacterium dentalis TaxID=2014528 RepID=UPI00370D5E44
MCNSGPQFVEEGHPESLPAPPIGEEQPERVRYRRDSPQLIGWSSEAAPSAA